MSVADVAVQDIVVENALSHYYDELGRVACALPALAPSSTPGRFSPGPQLPTLDQAVREFLAPSTICVRAVGEYGGHELTVLDLARNERTRTTKTFASLVIVARAIECIRRTKQRIMIVTPTSANKGTALRDAVLRAYEHGLATPDTLRIVTIVPAGSLSKVWASRLSDDPELGRQNPLLVLDAPEPAAVKELAGTLVGDLAAQLHAGAGWQLWPTLQLDNYRVADSVRAFVEADHLPARTDRGRVHAHAVSSAFGLLGYQLGLEHLAADGRIRRRPGFLLIQHLRTPDMVLGLRRARGHSARPRYTDDGTGLLEQTTDPHFPSSTFSSDEQIDSTFYTRNPTTQSQMNDLVAAQGGTGIVVSLRECLDCYPLARELVHGSNLELPADPRRLREWALVMGITGVTNAIDRGLIPERAEVVLHASGSYTVDDFTPVAAEHVVAVDGAADAAATILEAAR